MAAPYTIARRMLSSETDAGARQVGHEPAGERVAGAGRIEDLLQRERGHVEGAGRLDQQRPVLALLDHHAPGALPQDPPAGAVDVPVAR